MLFDRVGDGGQIHIDRVERFARLLVDGGLGLRAGELVLADVFQHLRLAVVGELGETAHVGEPDGDFLAPAAEG